MAVIYDSSDIYINGATDPRERIARIEAVIDALLQALATQAVNNSAFKEYSLDDGQTKIRSVYTSAGDIERSINALEKLKQQYINRINGRVMRLVDGKNFY